MMIDWISAVIEEPNRVAVFDTGHFMARKRGGEVSLLGGMREVYEGSFSDVVTVKSSQNFDLFFSGNPQKFFQGHNLFGSDDWQGLYLETSVKIAESGGQYPSAETFVDGLWLPPKLTRVDLTRSYRFDSDAEARAYVRDVAGQARSRHGGAIMRGETAYLGNNSQLWTFKVYSKFDEIQSRKKGRMLSQLLPHRKLEDWCEGVVRFELTLKSKEIQKVGAIEPGNTLDIWSMYYEKITWNRNREMNQLTAEEKALPQTLQRAMVMWRAGTDLRDLYPKTSFYRLRREILKELGVDIAVNFVIEQPDLSPVLRESGWDPEPLQEFFYEPGEELKRSYGFSKV
jgi:hypothetical protein